MCAAPGQSSNQAFNTMDTNAFSLEQRLQQLRSAGVHSVFAQFTDIL